MPRGHARVASCLCVVRKTLVLLLSAASNSLPNSGGIFFHAFAGNIAVFHRRHFDMEIDSIEKWSRDSLTISLDNDRTAAAFALQITEVSARAGVHRCHQHELAGEDEAAGRARDHDFSVFERVTHYFQGRSFEIR